jgi:hypothetical protein
MKSQVLTFIMAKDAIIQMIHNVFYLSFSLKHFMHKQCRQAHKSPFQLVYFYSFSLHKDLGHQRVCVHKDSLN